MSVRFPSRVRRARCDEGHMNYYGGFDGFVGFGERTCEPYRTDGVRGGDYPKTVHDVQVTDWVSTDEGS